ncbi:MAG: phosphoadenosine phosphosulfate reductase family protein [Desulfurococcaceae archaeon]
MKRIWPVENVIYWDPYANVPIIMPTQAERELFIRLRLTEPADARPAFEGDLELLANTIKAEFGGEHFYKEFFDGKFVLLNKTPHWDLMYEVVSSGNVWGQLFYDPLEAAWRFRPSYAGALRALERGIIDHVVVKTYPRVGLKVEASSSQRQLLVVDERGNVRGIAERTGEGKYEVVKTFLERRPPEDVDEKPATLWDVLKYNDERLEELEEKAFKFLRRIDKRYSPPARVVSYSGGKDSLVALDLATKAYGSVDVIFNDTGLELPETLSNVEVVAKRYGVRLREASAGDAFWRAVELFGPPAKDYRWCCKITKLVPIARLVKAQYPDNTLNIVGQRAFESLDRARSPLVWRNRWIRNLISLTPIQYWGQLSVWLYIHKYRLPYNEAYKHGFERLGCFMCPAGFLAEFNSVKRHWPSLWSRWEEVLERWRKRMNLPEDWVRLGLWRWLTPAPAKNRVARRAGVAIDWRREYEARLRASAIDLFPVEISRNGLHITIKFNKELVPDEALEAFASNVINMLKVPLRRDLNDGALVVDAERATLVIRGKALEARLSDAKAWDLLITILKIIYRLHGCAKCGSCVMWCPMKVVRLTRYGPLVTKPCGSCVTCIEVCPIADQLVRKVVMALVTDRPVAWKSSDLPSILRLSTNSSSPLPAPEGKGSRGEA